MKLSGRDLKKFGKNSDPNLLRDVRHVYGITQKCGVSADIDYLKVWDVFNNRLREVDDSTLEKLINTEEEPK